MRPYTIALEFKIGSVSTGFGSLQSGIVHQYGLQFVSDGLGRFIHPEFDHAWEFETYQAALDAAQVANLFYKEATKIAIWFHFGQPDGEEIVCR